MATRPRGSQLSVREQLGVRLSARHQAYRAWHTEVRAAWARGEGHEAAEALVAEVAEEVAGRLGVAATGAGGTKPPSSSTVTVRYHRCRGLLPVPGILVDSNGTFSHTPRFAQRLIPRRSSSGGRCRGLMRRPSIHRLRLDSIPTLGSTQPSQVRLFVPLVGALSACRTEQVQGPPFSSCLYPAGNR